jgi:hypothetical protein
MADARAEPLRRGHLQQHLVAQRRDSWVAYGPGGGGSGLFRGVYIGCISESGSGGGDGVVGGGVDICASEQHNDQVMP